MKAGDIAEIALLALQTVNAIRRQMDPSSSDPIVAAIFADAASGAVTEDEARDRMANHMRARGETIISRWRQGAPDDAA